jgi:hypothetical protein
MVSLHTAGLGLGLQPAGRVSPLSQASPKERSSFVYTSRITSRPVAPQALPCPPSVNSRGTTSYLWSTACSSTEGVIPEVVIHHPSAALPVAPRSRDEPHAVLGGRASGVI